MSANNYCFKHTLIVVKVVTTPTYIRRCSICQRSPWPYKTKYMYIKSPPAGRLDIFTKHLQVCQRLTENMADPDQILHDKLLLLTDYGIINWVILVSYRVVKHLKSPSVSLNTSNSTSRSKLQAAFKFKGV